MAFAYELVVITLEEFDDLRAGRLSLPEGWYIGFFADEPRLHGQKPAGDVPTAA